MRPVSLVLVHGDRRSPESISVWRFEGTPKCGVCDGRGYRLLPRNFRWGDKPGDALLDLLLRECATCAGTGDRPDIPCAGPPICDGCPTCDPSIGG